MSQAIIPLEELVMNIVNTIFSLIKQYENVELHILLLFFLLFFFQDEYSYGHDGYNRDYDRTEHMVPDKVKKEMAYMQDMITDRKFS